ncbi:MAG: hypothetical protein WCF24_04140 [Acidimicrobiales bacterium]
MSRLLRVALVVAAVVPILALSAVTNAGEAVNPSSGYGAVLGLWVRAHPPNATDCPIDSCYGPIVHSASVEPEFSFLQMFRGHVVGYDEALPRGTSLLAAELEVAQQFPSDVSIPHSVTVIHHDLFGHSCAVFDLYSKALAREFGRKGPAHQGDSVGVELATIGAGGSATFEHNSFDIAIITPVYLDDSSDC